MTLFKKKPYKFHDYSINMHSSLVAPHNDSLYIDERRYSDYLQLTADGILIMGLWSFIKGFIALMGDLSGEITESAETGLVAFIVEAVLGFFFFIILLTADVSFRYVIWKNASIESQKGKRKNITVVFSIILMIYGAYIISLFFVNVFTGRKIVGEDVISAVFDITSFLLLLNMLFSLFKLRRVRDDIAAAESEKSNSQ